MKCLAGELADELRLEKDTFNVEEGRGSKGQDEGVMAFCTPHGRGLQKGPRAR